MFAYTVADDPTSRNICACRLLEKCTGSNRVRISFVRRWHSSKEKVPGYREGWRGGAGGVPGTRKNVKRKTPSAPTTKPYLLNSNTTKQSGGCCLVLETMRFSFVIGTIVAFLGCDLAPSAALQEATVEESTLERYPLPSGTILGARRNNRGAVILVGWRNAALKKFRSIDVSTRRPFVGRSPETWHWQ